MHKKYLLAAIIVFAFIQTSAQDLASRFRESFNSGDTTGQATILKEWTKANPKDPELFIAFFNYYVALSRKEIVTMDSVRKSKDAYQITDTVTGKTIGYMNSLIQYEPKTLQLGFDKINEGIGVHPTRLDMRFGKIYMQGRVENFPAFTETIIQTIEYGNSIKNAWLWKDGKPLEDAVNFFLNSMQEYNGTIYDTGDDDLLPFMRKISEAVLKYHPNHVESLANVAMTWLIAGENDKAIPYLLKAEKIKPKDVVVLNNLAEAYKRKNDIPKAKSYYQKMIQYGNPDEVEYAKEKLKTLQ